MDRFDDKDKPTTPDKKTTKSDKKPTTLEEKPWDEHNQNTLIIGGLSLGVGVVLSRYVL